MLPFNYTQSQWIRTCIMRCIILGVKICFTHSIVNNFFTRFMNDNQILVVHSWGVYNFMGMIWLHSSLSFFCYHAFFSKKMFQILANSSTYILKPSLSVHWVYDNKAHTLLIWGIFCGSCSQLKELALVIRKYLPFLIIDANSPYWLQAPQKMSQIWMNSLLSWIHAVQTQWRF